MFQITAATLYGWQVVLYLAKEGRKTGGEISLYCGVSEGYVPKVLLELVRKGICTSHRGTRGGYKLCADPCKLRLLDIFEAFEGSINLVSISLDDRPCWIRQQLGQLEQVITQALQTTVADLLRKSKSE